MRRLCAADLLYICSQGRWSVERLKRVHRHHTSRRALTNCQQAVITSACRDCLISCRYLAKTCFSVRDSENVYNPQYLDIKDSYKGPVSCGIVFPYSRVTYICDVRAKASSRCHAAFAVMHAAQHVNTPSGTELRGVAFVSNLLCEVEA